MFHLSTPAEENGGIVMVTLSVGVLQCNLLANVSTVAGKPFLGSPNSSDLDLKPWGEGLSTAPVV